MIRRLKQSCSSGELLEVWGDGEMGSQINNFSKLSCMATPDSRF
ncbi:MULTISPECIES: hypothetical protein [Moorena]|nr:MULTISPECIES: hypothetical protein [Moorena]